MSDIRVYLMMVSVEKGLGADENKIKDFLKPFFARLVLNGFVMVQ